MLLEMLLVATLSHGPTPHAAAAVMAGPDAGSPPGSQRRHVLPVANCTQIGGGQATVNQLKAAGHSCKTTSFGWHCEKMVMGRLICYDVYP